MKKSEKLDIESATPEEIIVKIFVGNCSPGNVDGKCDSSSFNRPYGIIRSQKTNTIYVTDSQNNCVRRIKTSGGVTTVNLPFDPEDGFVSFKDPRGICIDQKTGEIYIADTENHRIAQLKHDDTIKTLVGGFKNISVSDKLCGPYGVACDRDVIYILDTFNHKIKKIEEGKLTTLAGSIEGFGDGIGEDAKFSKPMGFAVGPKGNVFVCDTYNYRIRKITPQGVVTTFAGGKKGHRDGSAVEAKFGCPTSICATKNGYLFVGDNDPPCIRRIAPNGSVTTITGLIMGNSEGQAPKAKFYVIGGICLDHNDDLLVVDTYNHCVKKLSVVNNPQ